LLEVNDAYARMSGYSRAELRRMRITDLEADETEGDVRKRIARIIEVGADTFETHHRRKDGGVWPVEANVVWSRVGRGHFFCFFRDISERKRAEAQVTELLERVALATRAAGVGVWDYDIVGGRLIWNEEMFRLYGVAAEDFHGNILDWSSRLHPDDFAGVMEAYQAALAGEQPFETEFRIVRSDGEVRRLEVRTTILRDAQGQPLRMLGTNWDVTDNRSLLEALGAARQAAEAASIAKSRFLALVSHELRTPLNAILGFGELLHTTETDATRRKQLHLVCEAGRGLMTVIDSVLDLAEIEVGRLQAEVRTFNLEHELLGLVATFQETADDKGLALALRVLPDVPPVLRGVTGLLRAVLSNLIGNALKFTSTGRVEIIAEAMVPLPPGTRGAVLFRVRDTGPGIKPENLEHIFEPFEQEDQGMDRSHGGVGLGLALSRRLVALMGGRIWAESEPGVGSCFLFSAEFEAVAIAADDDAAGLDVF
jgi:PAS domain S-box-containing protein